MELLEELEISLYFQDSASNGLVNTRFSELSTKRV